MNLPGWVTGRWVVVPAAAACFIAVWNGYVACNAGGHVEGRIVDGAGRPVPGATVILLERNFIMHNERQRTVTDHAGGFRFTGNDNHSLQLEAEFFPLGRSERRLVRLWFRAQNVTLSEPLRFAARLP